MRGVSVGLVAVWVLVFAHAAGTPQGPEPLPPVSETRTAAVGVSEVVRQAIGERAPLSFRYAADLRTVHPHRLGVSKTGKTLLRAWEVSKAGAPSGAWKLYDLSKIRAPKPLLAASPFPIAPGYTPADKALPSILAEIPCKAPSLAPGK